MVWAVFVSSGGLLFQFGPSGWAGLFSVPVRVERSGNYPRVDPLAKCGVDESFQRAPAVFG